MKRAANKSIEDTAKRVVSEVETQVSVLGRGGDIQRAIRMYGRIGATLEPLKTSTGYVHDRNVPNTERSMVSLFMGDMWGTTEGLLEDVFFLPSNSVQRVSSFFSAYRILLGVIALSMMLNVFLSSRSTAEYWHIRKAENFMEKIGVKPNNAIVRMISLKEIDNLVANGFGDVNITYSGVWYMPAMSSLTCSYDKFAELYALKDLADSNYDGSPEYSVPLACEKASRLRATRQQLGVMRYEYLASLHAVNRVEKELVEAEWMNWLSEEMHRCDLTAQMLTRSSDEILVDKKDSITKIREYCANCHNVWEDVRERFTEMS